MPAGKDCCFFFGTQRHTEAGEHISPLIMEFVPLPGLHEHFGQALSYEKMTAGTAALEQECAMDPAMAELRQHLLRHQISFCVFDSECPSRMWSRVVK